MGKSIQFYQFGTDTHTHTQDKQRSNTHVQPPAALPPWLLPRLPAQARPVLQQRDDEVLSDQLRFLLLHVVSYTFVNVWTYVCVYTRGQGRAGSQRPSAGGDDAHRAASHSPSSQPTTYQGRRSWRWRWRHWRGPLAPPAARPRPLLAAAAPAPAFFGGRPFQPRLAGDLQAQAAAALGQGLVALDLRW